MPPRSQDTICLTACPNQRSQYSWTISYSLLSHRGIWDVWHGESGPGREAGGSGVVCEQYLMGVDAEGPDKTNRVSMSIPGCAFGYLLCMPLINHICLCGGRMYAPELQRTQREEFEAVLIYCVILDKSPATLGLDFLLCKMELLPALSGPAGRNPGQPRRVAKSVDSIQTAWDWTLAQCL